MQIINTNLDLVAARQRAQAPAEPGADPQIAEDARRAEMARSLRLWLDLQDAVCGLLDSTTVQNRNAGTPGVRPDPCTSCAHTSGRTACACVAAAVLARSPPLCRAGQLAHQASHPALGVEHKADNGEEGGPLRENKTCTHVNFACRSVVSMQARGSALQSALTRC